MTAATTTEPRLTLRPARAHVGAVDGVWWPRENSADELLAVAAAVEQSFQKVVRVALSMEGWAGTPRRIGTGDDTLRVDLFRMGERHTVRLIGEDGRMMDLLLIAPGTDADTAEAEMKAGGDTDDLRTVAELLTPGVRSVNAASRR